MDARGWLAATAGNLSARIGPSSMAITASGVHKGRLTGADIIAVDLDGQPADPARRPSAEALLHGQLYGWDAAIGAVLHGHSVAGTVLSMGGSGPALQFQGYEMLKALAGQETHEAVVDLPVFDNDQDMRRLAAVIAPRLNATVPGYFLKGHGLYVWGATMDQALVRVEAVEFLLACELERRKLR